MATFFVLDFPDLSYPAQVQFLEIKKAGFLFNPAFLIKSPTDI